MGGNLKWEYLVNMFEPERGGEVIRRAVVPGGWLVQATTIFPNKDDLPVVTESMTFVPHTGDEWEIEDKVADFAEAMERLAMVKRVYN